MKEQDETRRQDFADHQAETAGIENGRQARFYSEDSAPRGRHARQQKAIAQSLRTQLDILMMNPAFAAAYVRVSDLIDEAQRKLNAALERVAERIEHLETVRDEMEENTAHLPDGTAVFQNADGTLQTADGRHLSEAEAASLLNPENLLSYERYKDVQGALISARARQDELSGVQHDVDDARGKRDGAESVDDLDKVEDGVQKIITDLEASESVRPIFGASAAREDTNPVNDPDLTIDVIAP